VIEPPAPGPLLVKQRLSVVEAAYRDLVMFDMAFEFRVGLHIAFVRTFASPSVAGLLAHTGHMRQDGHRRGTDTALFMYELIHHGFDSPTGLRIVARLNEMHRRWRISDEDYLWVLGTFPVLGVRMARRIGWRAVTPDDEQAVVDFYRELGARMGVGGVPATLADWEVVFDDYERTHLRPTAKGHELVAATREVVLAPVPRPLRPAAMAAATVLLDDPARTALGFSTPGPFTRAVVAGGLKVKAARRRRAGRPEPWFVSGDRHSDYPDGYTVDDLGPRTPTYDG